MSLDLTGSMVTPLSLPHFPNLSVDLQKVLCLMFISTFLCDICDVPGWSSVSTPLFIFSWPFYFYCRLPPSCRYLDLKSAYRQCRLQTVCLPPPASQCPAITASFVWVIPVCNNWHQVSLGSSVKYSADTDVTDVDSDARKGQLVCVAFDLTTVPM